MYTKYRVLLNIRIASSAATLSSRDVYLWKEVQKVPSENVESVQVDTVAKMKFVYVEDDLTFQNRIDEYQSGGNAMEESHNHPDFIALVEKYRSDGWIDCPDDVNAAIRAMWCRQEDARNEIRRKKGYVIAKRNEDLTTEDLRGGFSDELFKNVVLQKYISTPTHVFGFIGSYSRKHILDKYLEHFFMKLKPRFEMTNEQKRNILAVWLTSSDGRHFGDSLESHASGGIGEQKKFIKMTLKSTFNTAFVYTLEEHKGTFASTCELLEQHKDKLFDLSDGI